MNYTIYDNGTGDIVSIVSTNDLSLLDHMLSNCTYIEGSYDASAFYIDQGRPVEKPISPGEHYFWHNKQWHVDRDKTAVFERHKRNALLSDIDRVNPIWYASLATEQQQQLQQYRLDLLAVPQQPGFPTHIEWPTKPAWL